MNVLFLCTGNSCRSQMAEGFARKFWPDGWSAWSAGIETHGMNPYAQRVMAEAEAPLTDHYSKTLESLGEVTFDLVITVCGHADENCPWFPGDVEVRHHGFEDPPKLAAGLTDEEAILSVYRRVRDQIRAFVRTLPETAA